MNKAQLKLKALVLNIGWDVIEELEGRTHEINGMILAVGHSHVVFDLSHDFANRLEKERRFVLMERDTGHQVLGDQRVVIRVYLPPQCDDVFESATTDQIVSFLPIGFSDETRRTDIGTEVQEFVQIVEASHQLFQFLVIDS